MFAYFWRETIFKFLTNGNYLFSLNNNFEGTNIRGVLKKKVSYKKRCVLKLCNLNQSFSNKIKMILLISRDFFDNLQKVYNQQGRQLNIDGLNKVI